MSEETSKDELLKRIEELETQVKIIKSFCQKISNLKLDPKKVAKKN